MNKRYEKELERLRTLKKGEDTYYVDPPSLESINQAEIIIDCLLNRGYEEIIIDTHVESGVFIEIRKDNLHLNFETYSYFEEGEEELIIYSIGNRFENKDKYVIKEVYTKKDIINAINLFESYLEKGGV